MNDTPKVPAIRQLGDEGALQLGVAGGGDLRWAVVDLTGPLEASRRALDLSPIAAVALGRAQVAAAMLLRFTVKVPGQLVLEVLGDGPLGRVVAEVDRCGLVRGQIGEPQLATPNGGTLAIGWAVGQGLLRVTQENERGRYSSQVEIVSGEIGKDLVHFLAQSQQIHSAALVGVLPRADGIAAAGGFLVEAFPGVAEETVEHLEANIARLDGVSACLESGGLGALRDAVLAGLDREELERHRLFFGCRCAREKLLGQIRVLPSEDLDAITSDDGQVTAVCAFCGTQYAFDRAEMRVN